MTAHLLSGDLFAHPELAAIAHGCNCAGATGKGIAVEFRKRYPDMYAEYQRRCKAGEFVLGDVFTWQTDSEIVFNLGTQKTWRTKAKLDAGEASMTTMLQRAESMGVGEIGLPRIPHWRWLGGTGLRGASKASPSPAWGPTCHLPGGFRNLRSGPTKLAGAQLNKKRARTTELGGKFRPRARGHIHSEECASSPQHCSLLITGSCRGPFEQQARI